jgi:hypothetical protein
MHRRLFGSILLALTLAGSHQVVMAAPPVYVVCGFTNATDLFIVVESFGGVGQAVQQCVQFWNSFPRGIIR